MFHKIGYIKNFQPKSENFPTVNIKNVIKISILLSIETIIYNHVISRLNYTYTALYHISPTYHARHAYTTVYRNLYDTNKSYWLYADATFPPPVAKILEVTKINFLQDFERRRRPRLNVEKHSCESAMMTIPRDRSAAIYNNVLVVKPPLSFT